MPEMVTIKTSSEARRMLRLVAAMNEEKQYETIERLLKAELVRVVAALEKS